MKLLVAHDGSPQSAKALATAATLAKSLGALVTIVTVVPDLCLSTEELSPENCDLVAKSLADEARGQMAKVAKSVEEAGFTADIVIRHGRPADEIVAAATERGADMLVIGSTGKHGAKRLFLGSVSSRVAEYAACNVLIVK
ncbi:universal stress protein [Desulfolutivibrio sp.]|uniref:universal stress protein n=1 Tax=Desulfolutivibrio sp. TaxID=2773296 RepID=UPI002F965DC5